MAQGRTGTKQSALIVFVCALASTAPVGSAELTVSAASSLTEAFYDLAHEFETKHPGDRIALDFAASNVALKQIEQRKPVDVFASADEETMDRAAGSKLIDSATRRDFAANALVLIVSAETPVPKTIGRLARPPYEHVVIGNPEEVPAGRYAKQALIDDGIWDALQGKIMPVRNVREALNLVVRGEAQAGFVYASDAAIRKDKVKVALTVPTYNPVRYTIAATTDSTHADLARAFIALVTSPNGSAILKRYGFRPVSSDQEPRVSDYGNFCGIF
jgi:molybdate transport system substrate-binding protein